MHRQHYLELYIILLVLTPSVVHPAQMALKKAIANNKVAKVERLIAAGAAINQADANGDYPLHLAAMLGNTTLVQLLLDAGARVNQRAKSLSALDIAAVQGFTAVALLLVRHGAPFNIPVNSRYQSPLEAAVIAGQFSMVELFVVLGADYQRVHNGYTALHLATASGHTEIVAFLLKQPGTAVDQQTNIGKTPLHIAAANGHETILNTLLRHQAVVNLADNIGQSPLHAAAHGGHHNCVQCLLEHGAHGNQQDFDQNTPLHAAANGGHTTVVRSLLEHGANPRASGFRGTTPLHHAAVNGHINSCITLIAVNAELICCPDDLGRHPIHLATAEGHIDEITLLLILGADANQTGQEDNTPLHYAALRGHTAAVALLLEQPGIFVDQLNDFNSTPLRLAAHKEHQEIVRLLLAQGSAIPSGHIWDGLSEQTKAYINDNLHLAQQWTKVAQQWVFKQYKYARIEIPHGLAQFICSFATNVGACDTQHHPSRITGSMEAQTNRAPEAEQIPLLTSSPRRSGRGLLQRLRGCTAFLHRRLGNY